MKTTFRVILKASREGEEMRRADIFVYATNGEHAISIARNNSLYSDKTAWEVVGVRPANVNETL